MLNWQLNQLSIVPKKQTQTKKETATVNENVSTETKATKKASAPRAKAKTAKKTSARTKKAASPRDVVLSPNAARPVTTKTLAPTEEDVRIRAYFISERRHRLGLPGDSNGDWIEARRQLLVEAGVE